MVRQFNPGLPGTPGEAKGPPNFYRLHAKNVNMKITLFVSAP